MVMVVDAVVIGSGQNGLVAANILADAGWSVLVLEAADAPGGAVRTADITRKGYHHDLYSSFYPAGAASPAIAGLELEHYGLKWVHAPEVLAHVLPDDQTVLLSRDLDTTAKSLENFAAGDGDAWRAEFALWQRIRERLLNAMLGSFPPVRAGAGLLRTLGTGDALRFTRSMLLTARRLGDEKFRGLGGRLLFAGNTMHTDLGPDQSAGAVFGWFMAMLGQDVGFPVPEGGAGRLTDALVARLAEKGGEVVCGRRVTEVLMANGRATGVRDAEGEVVMARRAVLADVPATTLYRDLVGAEHLPAKLIADLDGFHWDYATVKVDWALSKPAPWTAPDARLAGTIHIGPDIDGLAGIANDLHCSRLPRNPFLIVGQMTTTDPTRSPKGTEAMWAYTRVPRGTQWTADRLKRRADRIEQILEQHAPGFGSRIKARVITGPAELEAANASLVEGAVNGGTAAIHQQLIFRPTVGTGRADTPIDRLYLAGSSAHPGGAVHGAGGSNAARAALARDGWAGGAYRTAISAAHKVLYR
ncbi:NAD(P)/FAD-dependent oxidoreductase [Actinocrispum sp. NPDC049592]|uniref:phytoene desaturase family protein n=1 Tax=Actinocrispum sp. NPDC049592 TaxID=3154835 RepID=UPI003436EA44